jgi:hypothetical protein
MGVLADCILVTCQFGLQYDSFEGCHRECIAPALRRDIRDVLPLWGSVGRAGSREAERNGAGPAAEPARPATDRVPQAGPPLSLGKGKLPVC